MFKVNILVGDFTFEARWCFLTEAMSYYWILYVVCFKGGSNAPDVDGAQAACHAAVGVLGGRSGAIGGVFARPTSLIFNTT